MRRRWEADCGQRHAGIISALVAGMLLAGCLGTVDLPSATPLSNTPLSSSSLVPTPTVDDQTPTPSGPPLSQRCTNRKYGFSVSYPSDWYTNGPAEVQGTQVAACTLFAPFADFDVLPEAVNVPIFLKHESGSLPDDGTALTIDGRSAVLVETEVNGEAWYIYYAEINEETRFVAFAFDNGSAPFGESQAVLDAMIRTVDLDAD